MNRENLINAQNSIVSELREREAEFETLKTLECSLVEKWQQFIGYDPYIMNKATHVQKVLFEKAKLL